MYNLASKYDITVHALDFRGFGQDQSTIEKEKDNGNDIDIDENKQIGCSPIQCA